MLRAVLGPEIVQSRTRRVRQAFTETAANRFSLSWIPTSRSCPTKICTTRTANAQDISWTPSQSGGALSISSDRLFCRGVGIVVASKRGIDVETLGDILKRISRS